MNTEANKQVGKSKIKKSANNMLLQPETSSLKIVLGVFNHSSNKIKVKEYESSKYLKSKWGKVDELNRSWSYSRDCKLGNINNIAVQSDTWVVSMVCQDEGVTSLKSLEDCLKKAADLAKYEKGHVHLSQKLMEDVPELTEELLTKYFVNNNINVFLYQ